MLCSGIRSNRRFCRRFVLFLLISFVLASVYMLFFSSDDKSLFQKIPGKFQSLDSFVFAQSGVDPSSKQACMLPELILWHPELKVYLEKPTPLRCSESEGNWVYTVNGTFRISKSAVEKNGDITCIYVPILRGKNDFEVTRGTPKKPMKDGDPLTSDVFEAKCVGSNGEVRTNTYVGVAPDKKVQSRKNTVGKDSLDLDILMFGFDSVSRMTWMRNLPKSYKYFVEVLAAVVLEGYNIVGDGTPQALLPILTGKTEPELPEARRGFAGATTVDGHPWIWNDLKELGYATQWGEDGASMGTFTYRMLGFKNQTVDHYLRTFYLAANKDFSKYRRKCLGSMSRHLNMLNWMKDFVDVYSNQRKFSFVFHSEYSHDGYTELKNVDDDLKSFLEYLHDSGHLDRAMLVLMADHGARFQNIRTTEQGKFEERNPFFGIRMPAWFQDKYPDAARNLKANSRSLVTPFDIHATFHDVISYSGPGLGNVSQRGISLFKEIPASRTCTNAAIEPHWCACLSWTPVSSTDDRARQAALALVRAINGFTDTERANCDVLHLRNVTKAVKWTAGEGLLRFRKSADTHGRTADLSDQMNSTEALFQITIVTSPGDAIYEGTVKFSFATMNYTVSEREISRINKYGLQPHCVMERLPHLRAYCYCKQQLSNTESKP